MLCYLINSLHSLPCEIRDCHKHDESRTIYINCVLRRLSPPLETTLPFPPPSVLCYQTKLQQYFMKNLVYRTSYGNKPETVTREQRSLGTRCKARAMHVDTHPNGHMHM